MVAVNQNEPFLACFRLGTRNISKNFPNLSEENLWLQATKMNHFLACFCLGTQNISKIFPSLRTRMKLIKAAYFGN